MSKIIFYILFISTLSIAQTYDFASATSRANFKKETLQTIKEVLRLELNRNTETKFREFFWKVELTQTINKDILAKLKSIYKNLDSISLETKRSFLECTYTLFKNELVEEAFSLMQKTDNAKLFAMCAVYLDRAKYRDLSSRYYNDLMERKFNDYNVNPILVSLNIYLNKEKKSLPNVKDLLELNIKEYPVLFSIQRKDRKNPGMMIIKNKNQFLRDKSGKWLAVPQMAMSVTNLPGFLTNGNTPEGIFSFSGIDTTTNIFIGSTRAIIMELPFEVSYSRWSHDSLDKPWSKELYEKLLPNSFVGYPNIYQTFYAGMAGRNEIIAHGTAIDPEYYKKEKYYPFTPSLGCLSAQELYDKDGKIIISGQKQLIDALKQNDITKGFVIVIELDDKNEPVSYNEIEKLLSKFKTKTK